MNLADQRADLRDAIMSNLSLMLNLQFEKYRELAARAESEARRIAQETPDDETTGEPPV